MNATAHAPAVARRAEGARSDGGPLADGPARDALRQAMRQLGEAEARNGPEMPAALCHALTEAARALGGGLRPPPCAGAPDRRQFRLGRRCAGNRTDQCRPADRRARQP